MEDHRRKKQRAEYPEAEASSRSCTGSHRREKKGGTGCLAPALAILLFLFLAVFLTVFRISKESSSSRRVFSDGEEPGQQQITVFKETEAEPETEAPPRYTENEDTRLIRKSGAEENEAADEIAASGADTGAEEGSRDITLTFAGDILFDSHYAIMASMLSRSGGSPDIETAFDEGLLLRMRGADVFMLNNEFPYSLQGAPLENKQFTFRADPAYAGLLKDMGADIVSLANNHMYDYGEVSLTDTLDTLDALDMPHVGAGRNIAEAASPFYFTNGQVKVGFICATQIERLGNPDTKGATETAPGVFRCLNSGRLVETITAMKSECDFIVAYLHWGTESTEVVDEHQKKLAKEAAEAGADLIIGDHPHVLQKIGYEGEVPVVYSLGNYLFNSGAQDTCLVTAVLDGENGALKSLQFVPARQEGCRTKLLTGAEANRVLDYMRSISDVSFDENGFISKDGL